VYEALTTEEDRHLFVLKVEGDVSKFRIKNVRLPSFDWYGNRFHYFDYVWLFQGYVLGAHVSDCGRYFVWSKTCDPSRGIEKTTFFTFGYKDVAVIQGLSEWDIMMYAKGGAWSELISRTFIPQ
jgi:hypothetical protein